MHVCTKPYVLYVNECQMSVVSVNILKSAQSFVSDICVYVTAASMCVLQAPLHTA